MKYQIENKDYYFWQFPVTIGNRRWYLKHCEHCKNGYVGREECPHCKGGWHVDDPIEVIRIKESDVNCFDDHKRYNFYEMRFNTLDPREHLNIK